MFELWLKYRASAYIIRMRMKEVPPDSPRYRELNLMYQETIRTAGEMRKYCGSLGNLENVTASVFTLEGTEKEVRFSPRFKDAAGPNRRSRPKPGRVGPQKGHLDADPDTENILKSLLL